jgi:nucleotide-binding universal stress UspA family protein
MNGKVMCLVRGGEAGRKVQEKAIAYARNNQKELVFLHVVDASRVSDEEELEEVQTAVKEELIWLAHVTLSMARRRATGQGVNAKIDIITGSFFDTVLKYATQPQIEVVFMGSPHSGTPDYDERLKRVKKFAQRLQEAANVEVVVIDDQ